MKTREELAEELAIRCKLEEERMLSNELYAKILVEKIVFGLVSLITVGAVLSLLRIIWKWVIIKKYILRFVWALLLLA